MHTTRLKLFWNQNVPSVCVCGTESRAREGHKN